jgi:hypothetical protein
VAIPEPTCREVARWLFSEAEKKLSQAQQEVLEPHMVICEACVRVRVQVKLMNEVVAAWRCYREEDDMPSGPQGPVT